MVARYQIQSLLGQGGMGKVFLALDQELLRPVAIKFLTQVRDLELAFFREEVQLLSHLSHPNLVAIYDYHSASQGLWDLDKNFPLQNIAIPNGPFFTMEPVSGTSLASLPRKLPIEEWVELFAQLCQGLHYLHSRNILHRDLKPSNVMLAKNGEVKLLDFGLATVQGSSASRSEIRGTPGYMAPEAYWGEYEVQSDLFALGVVFYQCMSGKIPFLPKGGLGGVPKESPTPLRELLPEFPEFFTDLIQRLLALSLPQRPPSALAVLRYLTQHTKRSPSPVAEEDMLSVLQKLPFVGREEELQKVLREIFSPLISNRSSLVSLTGPTGSGRSRFLEEIKWPAQLKDVRCAFVSADSSGQWQQELAKTLGIETKPSDSILDLPEKISSLSFERRLLLVFSDLQDWTESALKELLLFLRLALRGSKNVVFCLEANSDLVFPQVLELDELVGQSPQSLTLTLSDLSEQDCKALLNSIPLERPIHESQLQKIISNCGGRPKLLLEAMRHLGDTEEIRPDIWASSAELQALTQRRLQRLPTHALDALALLVTHPYPCSLRQFSDLWNSPKKSWEEALLELDRLAYTKARSEEHPFIQLSQPALKEVYRRCLPSEKISASHACWSVYLLGQLGESPQFIPEAVAVAEHCFHAGQRDLAMTWGLAAAEYFERQYQVKEALALYERLMPLAKTPVERYTLQGSAAPLLYRLGRMEDALHAYELWFQDRHDDEHQFQKCKYFFFTGQVLWAAERESEARERFEACLAIGDRGRLSEHRPFHTRALSFLATIEERHRRYPEGKALLQEALALSAEVPALRGEIEHRLGQQEQAEFHYSEAQVHFQRSLEYFRRADLPQAQAISLESLSTLHAESGELQTALEFSEEALRLTRIAGQVLQWARFKHNHALIQVDQGQYGLAWEGMMQSKDILEILGNARDREFVTVHGADLYLRLGLEQRAAELFQQAAALPKISEEGRGEFLMKRAEWLYLIADYPSSEQVFSEAALPSGNPSKIRQLMAEIGRCRAKIRQGLSLDSDPVLRSALANLRNLTGPIFQVWRMVLEIFSMPEGEGPPVHLIGQLTGQLKTLGLPEVVRDIEQLLSESFRRQGLTESAQSFLIASKRELVQIYHCLPEEFKMDFEKKRQQEQWDKTLSAMAPTPPPAEKSPGVESKAVDASNLSETRFRQFCEITRQISQRYRLSEILERVLDASLEITGAERGLLLLKNEEVQDPIPGYEIKTARHLSDQSLKQADFKISMTAVKNAIEQGSVILTENAQTDPQFQEQKSVVQLQLKAILALPLESEGKIIGAIYLDHRYHPNCFNPQDLSLLQALAAQAALAIQKAQFIEALSDTNQTLVKKVEHHEQRIEVLSGELDKARGQLRYGYEEIIGQSPVMMEVFRLLDHVTDTVIPVWVHGESGTGKELVARSLHFNSSRKMGPFVSENCSAIPETLLESELFGHKKGAFTHADRDRKGLFEQADGGTLFLDEVADMSLNMQVKLLRVLQDAEVRPIGSGKKIKVDVRLVTASNKDLPQLVAADKFRQDLFFRINGLTIRLPALRDRPSDIPILVVNLLKKIAKDYKLPPCEISDQAYEVLMQHTWPGNVRELESVLRNALLFAKGRIITPEFLHLTRAMGELPKPVSTGLSTEAENIPQGDFDEKQLIVNALKKHRMNKRKAAEELNISLRTFYVRMERYGIPKNKPILTKFLGF